MNAGRDSLIQFRIRGLRRWLVALVKCGPRWTIRHLKPFGGLR